MIRLRIGIHSATLHGREWYCADADLKRQLEEIAGPIMAARRDYEPPPENETVAAVLAAYPEARVTKRVAPQWKPDRVY